MIRSNMETVRLKQFCTIAETGSISKAAELLHITSSGLSKSMKILQEELSQVFLRSAGRGVALTSQGTAFYKNAKAFLEMEQRLFYTTHKTQHHPLRIGTTESFMATLCENIIKIDHSPQSVSILDLTPGQIEQMVAKRELDYGITYTPHPMERIEVIEIGSYQLGCFHLAGQFTDMDISEIPFAVPSTAIPINPLGIKERDGWIEGIVPRDRQYLVNLLSTGIELTLMGLCAIYMPKHVAVNINKKLSGQYQLIEKSLPKELNTEQRAFLITHSDKVRDEQFNKMKQIVSLMIHSS